MGGTTAFNKEVSSRVSSEGVHALESALLQPTNEYIVAETIARDFYRAMGFKAQRSYLTTYFVAENDMGAGHKLPDILYNGTKYSSPDSFQQFIEGLPKLTYDIESLSAVIINPALAMEGFNEQDIKKGRAAVVSVAVNGTVTSDQDEDKHIFSDNFVMMPNPEANKNGRRDRGKREWLIGVLSSRLVG